MINIIPVDIDFIYNLKKTLNLYVFNNPLAISDFIDILDSELRESFGLDAIRSFEFLDDEYQFTIVIDDKHTEDYSNRMEAVIANSIMRFCAAYKTAIEVGLNTVADKATVTTFDDCMISGQKSLLVQIVQKLEFKCMDGMCTVIKLY